MDRTFTSRLLRDSALTGIGTSVGLVFHIGSMMVATRYASRTDFGIYVLILATIHLMTVFSGLGLDLTLAKRASDTQGRSGLSAFLPICLIRAVSLSLSCAILTGLALLKPDLLGANLPPLLPAMIVLCALAGFRDLLFSFMQGLRQFRHYATVQVASAMLKCALFVAGAVMGALDLRTLVYVEIASTALALLALLLGIPWRAVRAVGFVRTEFRPLLTFSTPLYANNLLTVLHDRLAVFMIAALVNPVGVAYFEVAAKGPEACLRLFHSFITVYFPSLSALFAQGDRAGAQRIIQTALTLMSSIIMGAVLAAFLYRQELIVLLFSAKYADAATAFALLMLGFYLRAVGNIMGYSLISAGFPSAPMRVNTVSCVANVAGLVTLIPVFGFVGAVYSLLLMNATSVVLFGVQLAKRGICMDLARSALPLLAAMTLTAAALMLGLTPALRIIPLAIYVAVCWLWIPQLQQILKRVVNRNAGVVPVVEEP